MVKQRKITEFATATTTPQPTPTYAEIKTDEDLIEWSRSYAEKVVAEYPVEINLSLVSWGVKAETKRQVAAMESISLPPAKTGVPIDWDKARESITELSEDPCDESEHIDDIRECHIGLSRSAFESLEREEWEGAIRHELGHVWQHQRFGDADHGRTFDSIAADLDAPTDAPQFADERYRLLCTDCGEIIGHRYRRSKTVKQPEKYRSKCCSAKLDVELGPAHPDFTG